MVTPALFTPFYLVSSVCVCARVDEDVFQEFIRHSLSSEQLLGALARVNQTGNNRASSEPHVDSNATLAKGQHPQALLCLDVELVVAVGKGEVLHHLLVEDVSWLVGHLNPIENHRGEARGE